MILTGIITNYIILKVLTEKVTPTEKLQGLQGMKGEKGMRGERGRLGKKGPRNNNADIVGNDGQRGDPGSPSECSNGDVENDLGEVVGGCSSQADWYMMGLISYNARDKDGCLFGYKKSAGGVCKSPIQGVNPIEDNMREWMIDNWQERNSDVNCNYKHNNTVY